MRIRVEDGFPVLFYQFDHPAIEMSFQVVEFHLAFQLIRRQGMKAGHGSIAQNGFNFKYMLAGGFMLDGIESAGIVTYHATQHASIGCGGIGSEEKMVPGCPPVKRIADDAGLHMRLPVTGFDTQNLRHMTRYIHHVALSGGLSGQGSAAGPSRNRSTLFDGAPDQLLNVGRAPWEGYARRQLFIHGGVVGIKVPGKGIGAYI